MPNFQIKYNWSRNSRKAKASLNSAMQMWKCKKPLLSHVHAKSALIFVVDCHRTTLIVDFKHKKLKSLKLQWDNGSYQQVLTYTYPSTKYQLKCYAPCRLHIQVITAFAGTNKCILIKYNNYHSEIVCFFVS